MGKILGYSRIRFIRHPKGPKQSDEYAGVTNKPNAKIMHFNGRAISRGFQNVMNKPDSTVIRYSLSFYRILETALLGFICDHLLSFLSVPSRDTK